MANDQGKTLDLEREKRLDAKRTLKNSETDLLKEREELKEVTRCDRTLEGSFTVDVIEPKHNRPNTMNLVEKWAQELSLCKDFVNGRAGLLRSGIIKGVEEG